MNTNPYYSRMPNGDFTHWWQALCAVPQNETCQAYSRLKRVWFDHTLFNGPSLSRCSPEERAEKQSHWFTNPNCETHLTVSLWENFALFECPDWLPRVYDLAGLRMPDSKCQTCRWSYEWVGYRTVPERPKSSTKRMCDVVVGFEGADESRGVLVVEAKRLKAKLGKKDLIPDYYLGIREIEEFGNQASLMYLIDEAVREKALEALTEMPVNANVGLLTWQQLAGIQIELAATLQAPEAVRHFVASAIQYQFAQNNIRPVQLSAPYLEREPSMLEIDALPKSEKQPMSVHSEPQWRL